VAVVAAVERVDRETNTMMTFGVLAEQPRALKAFRKVVRIRCRMHTQRSSRSIQAALLGG
jgi:hypothetical protein